ncbi:MAG: extracellular solute-binding protein [Verrucomicrobiota bacterium]
MNRFPHGWNILFLIPLLFLISCGGGKKEDSADSEFPPYDNTEEVQAFYGSQPERYVFATLDDLPKDLTWDDGMDLPDLGSPNAKKGGTSYWSLPDFPRTLRRYGPDSTGSFRTYILDDVTMKLAHRHPNVEGYFPGLAKEWAVDKENATIYAKINPDARWSDGVPVTTDDIAIVWYILTSDYAEAPFAKHYIETKYKRLTIYDKHTFAITTTAKHPDLEIVILDNGALPAHFFKEFGPDFVQRYQWRFWPTTGPFIILPEDIKKGRSIALSRLDSWWAKDMKFWRNRYNEDRIEFSVIRDPEKTFEAFKKGDLDMARLNLAKYWYERLPDDDPLVAKGYIHKYTFYNKVPLPSYGFWINTAKPLLDNIHVRQGIHYATDFDLVNRKIFRGDWKRLNTMSDGYGDLTHPSLRYREFSVEKAREKFAEAGFTIPGPDGILTNEKGERLSFTLTTGYKNFADSLTVIKQQALKCGLEFNLEMLESTAAFKKAQEKNHEISFAGLGHFPTEIYPRYYDFWHSETAYEDGKLKPQTNNMTSSVIEGMDELITAYDKTFEHEKKRELAYVIQEKAWEHAAWVPAIAPPTYRVGSWRWVQWPEDFNVKRSSLEREFYVHWLDDSLREETQTAMKEEQTFSPTIKTFDQFK